MRKLILTLVALVVALTLSVGSVATPDPADAAPAPASAVAHPGMPSSLDVCRWVEVVIEQSVGNVIFPTGWRTIHYGTAHVFECEFYLVYAGPAKTCWRVIHGDPNLYHYTGVTYDRCWW